MVTSGGWRGMNGAQRRLALAFGAGFAVILIAVTIANATSMIADFAAAGVRESDAHVWVWQVTSIIGWLATVPAIWWLVAKVRPPRFGWLAIAAIYVLASVPISLLHIDVMIGLRSAVYAANGERYVFGGGLAHPWLYEFRKDVGTYLQFAAIAAILQWLLARAGAGEPIAKPAASISLAVSDGPITHHVPAEEIDWVAAAGNYVEVKWRDRVLLHRATLAAIADELGAGFVRIHRGRLVRRAAIRQVVTERSGDFTVELADGTQVRGSRRFPLA